MNYKNEIRGLCIEPISYSTIQLKSMELYKKVKTQGKNYNYIKNSKKNITFFSKNVVLFNDISSWILLTI